MRNSLIRVKGTKKVKKQCLRGRLVERNNVLNLKTAKFYMPILHSRLPKFYRTKKNPTSRGDS